MDDLRNPAASSVLVWSVASLAVLVALCAAGLIADVIEPRDAAWFLVVLGLPLGVFGGIAAWVSLKGGSR